MLARSLQNLLLIVLVSLQAVAQECSVPGKVLHAESGLTGATISIRNHNKTIVSKEDGSFCFPQLAAGRYMIVVSMTGYQPIEKKINFPEDKEWLAKIEMQPLVSSLEEVVITGTMKPVQKLQSPVSVEVYTSQFLKKNPTPSIFEALQNVNGVRPQLNCNVCNTGDIHINGLEGPYTMITIDGMPIVSGLASVYGLFGIPTRLIDRIEIVKGPASGLYGSEAIGGLINIITREPEKAPLFSVEAMSTSWLEHNIDVGAKFNLGTNAKNLFGANYFNYQHPFDKNADRFTDITLQHRISFFNKLSMERKNNRTATLAARYFYENRWGGDMRWNKTFRGTDSIYGESIYTGRWELIGKYQLPVKEKLIYSVSATGHKQDSYYGDLSYNADQKIFFNQLIWDKEISYRHNLLAGIAARRNYYDDNSTATMDTLTGKNAPEKYWIPGVFVQEEWTINSDNILLLGLRYDHHPIHKNIFTPRIAYKYSHRNKRAFRINAGTGFRVVSLFTEEHAALTGARKVEIKEALKPERSFNMNFNYTDRVALGRSHVNIDASVWYSHFTNQIIADYDSDPNKIIYQNLDGYSFSKGATLNLEISIGNRLRGHAGVTLLDVKKVEIQNGKKDRIRPVLNEKWSGTWALSYNFPAQNLVVDYTGNIYGPMRLPLLSPLDPRPEYSPVWSIQNLQVTKKFGKDFEIFGGVKNLLNWTPAKNSPFLIARSHDPFDKKVEYDVNGNILATSENPYAISFDPSYVYAPNQGMRVFLGLRYSVDNALK